MSRAFIAAVGLVQVVNPETGLLHWVPDLEAGLAEHVHRDGGSDRFWIHWYDRDGDAHGLLLHHVGLHAPSATRIFLCHGSAKIAKGLAHIGAKLFRLRDLASRPAWRDWLIARGFSAVRRVRDGALIGVVPRHMIAGMGDPLSAALDNDWTDEDGQTIADFEIVS